MHSILPKIKWDFYVNMGYTYVILAKADPQNEIFK